MLESASLPLIKSEVELSAAAKCPKKCAAWSKDAVQDLLSRQLITGNDFTGTIFKEWPDKIRISNRRLGSTLRSGFYNIPLLKELLQNGMPAESIVKAMKYGLISLNPADLYHFKTFGVEPNVLENKDLWSQKLDNRLIENLYLCDLKEKRCWAIIIYGLAQQNERTISRLVLGGIDVAGILNWEDTIGRVPSETIDFLRRTGIDEDIIELVEEYGIEKETIDYLDGLIGTEICRESSEVVICKCDSVKLEEKPEVKKTESIDTLNSIQNFLKKFICSCPSKTSVHLSPGRNNYLRQNVMIALTWAMARMLHYRPTDPQYYLAYQLLRWSHGSVSDAEKREACKFVACATERMDFRLAMKKLNEEREVEIKEALENIPCDECLNREEIYRNKGCPKCGRGRRQPEPCDLPELCSSCRLPTERTIKREVCDFPEVCSSCKLPDYRKKGVCDFPEICSSCKLIDRRKKGVCDFPEVCSSCKILDHRKKGVCDFPEVCSSCKLLDHRKKEVCDFPEICSSCKLPVHRGKDVCDYPKVCSSCKISGKLKKEICDLPEVCSSCKLTADACDFPEICDSCKDLREKNQGTKYDKCHLPKLCSSCDVSEKI